MEKKNQIEPFTDQESEEMWATIVSRIRIQEQHKRKSKVRILTTCLSTAAILIIAGIITYRNYVMPQTYYANSTEKIIFLKDSSQVTLLPGAKLTVERNFPSETRDVYLYGNAIFRVSKSKKHPFIVHSSNYETKVLGTVFKITQKGQDFNVDLFEGKVKINKIGKPKDYFILNPKETFANMGSEKVGTVVSTSKMIASKVTLATIAFNDVSLKDIAAILERTYGIKLIIPKDHEYSRITAVKEKASAEDFIKQIAIQLNLNTKKIDDRTFQLED
ncbi:hypothetical protein BBI01_01155 [Chryseobacterium artocarpi]|uniref:Uncharacterized protein n=1 Tax=Chryseobacterium artocarpi TaxID=1414727 RepID=A0A1B8ZZR5_9FLAO|nr:FecR family protein [Chryseobacterium artocarpi]OCA77099.1 hypothetical protein BBI01_01155 [Chryseobacterium artocarpi]